MGLCEIHEKSYDKKIHHFIQHDFHMELQKSSGVI
jgi:hypothetical protein